MSASLKEQRKRRIKSCLSCHARKVRCDRQKPCGECSPKGLDCIYQTVDMPSQARDLPQLTQFKDRNVVALNATKALASYWQDFHRTSRGGPRPVATVDIFGPSVFNGPISSLIPPPQQAMEMVWAGQVANVLHMFEVASEMTMPYFQTFFNPQLSTIYWKFLTRPVHVDLTEGFDNPSWRLEQRAAQHRLKMTETERHGSFALSRSRMPLSDPLMPSLDPAPPVYVDLARSRDILSTLSPLYSPNPSLFEPSFVPDEQGLFQAPTGRRFDAMTDFLFLKSPRVEDILSLLEYGVAFLRGSSLLGWSDVNTLISFNVERIIHSLVYRLRHELDINLVDRLVNCISIFALHREFTGQFATIAPYMIVAFKIAVEHDLHRTDPGNISRMILTVLYYTEIPSLRDEYESLILSTFSELPGIFLRARFSYVSGALLTPDSEPEASSFEYWKKVEQYLIEAEYILPHLDTAIDLPAPCTILFKCLFAMMRAELGPRVGQHEWPVQQACLIAKHLCSLEDRNTFIAVGLLVRFRIHSRRSSVLFNLHGRQMLVSDYLAEQIRDIPTMPVVPIIPGEEPFLMDTAKILETQILSIPTEGSPRLTTNRREPDSPDVSGDSSTNGRSSTAGCDDSASSSSAGNARSASGAAHAATTHGVPLAPHTAATMIPTNNTLAIDNSSPFLKDTGTPDTPIVKTGTTISKSIIGY
jgi:hypothetical protein